MHVLRLATLAHGEDTSSLTREVVLANFSGVLAVAVSRHRTPA